MAAAYVSHTTGAASRSVTVPAGTDRLLVAVALYTSTNAAQSATYGGVSMAVASTANGFVQIFYMLSPTAGAATLSVTGSSVDTVIAAHYTGIGSFQSGQQASTASASFSPTRAGLIVFGMEATSTSHTPLASTNERHDSGGGYYADRIVTGTGSVSVGVSSATGPDYAGAIFLEPVGQFSGSPSVTIASASGTAAVTVSATGAASKGIATTSGTAAVLVAATGSAAKSVATSSGTAGVLVSASGTASKSIATASGTAVLIAPRGGTLEVSSTLAQRVRARHQLREVVTTTSRLVQRVRAVTQG